MNQTKKIGKNESEVPRTRVWGERRHRVATAEANATEHSETEHVKRDIATIQKWQKTGSMPVDVQAKLADSPNDTVKIALISSGMADLEALLHIASEAAKVGKTSLRHKAIHTIKDGLGDTEPEMIVKAALEDSRNVPELKVLIREARRASLPELLHMEELASESGSHFRLAVARLVIDERSEMHASSKGAHPKPASAMHHLKGFRRSGMPEQHHIDIRGLHRGDNTEIKSLHPRRRIE